MNHTGPTIWPTQNPGAKPSPLQFFSPGDILTSVTSGYPNKYQKVVPSIFPLIITFWYSLSCSFWGLFNKIQPTPNSSTKNIIISYSSNLSCSYFMLLISPRGGVIGTSNWFQCVLLQPLVFPIMVWSCIPLPL